MFFSSYEKKIKKLKQKLSENPNEVFSITEVFRDPNLARLVAGKLGLSPKNKVSLRDLENIQVLEASGQNITSLDGIEFLNRLERADFSNNAITSLPDYSDNPSSLGLNKNTLLYMDLSANPFLSSDTLFSMDNTENRRRFFSSFDNAYSRFNLGEQQENLFSEKTFNPKLIQLFIENTLPRTGVEDLNRKISGIFTKYLIGKNIFYNQEISDQDYIFDQGLFKIKRTDQDYLNEENLQAASDLIEKLIPERDKYLLRSLINANNESIPGNLKTKAEVLEYFKEHPDEISKDYILTDSGYTERSSYGELKTFQISSDTEKRLAQIENQTIRNQYLKYLEFHKVLEEYARDKNSLDVVKYLKKSDEFINNFLDQYQKLQNNQLLSELQKAKIKEAEPALEKFVNNFTEEARAFFEQDIFGLEVDMKYIDMLAEANRKF